MFDPIFVEEDLQSEVEVESISFASSAVCRKLLERTDCDNCKCIMQTSTALFDSEDTVRPSEHFQTQFRKVLSGVNQVLPHLCAENYVSKAILESIGDIKVDVLGCDEHKNEMTKKLKQITINYALIQFCKNINNLLYGKTTEVTKNYNAIEKKAIDQKRKRIGKFSDIFEV